MTAYAGFPLNKCPVRISMHNFSLGENLELPRLGFQRIYFPSLYILIVHMTDMFTSRNLNLPQDIAYEVGRGNWIFCNGKGTNWSGWSAQSNA